VEHVLANHAKDVWACDFLQVSDLFFRSLFAFFIIELQSRKEFHVGVTRSLTDAWVGQQLREATPYGMTPKYLLCDNDSNLDPVSPEWRRRVPLQFARSLITLPEPM
jgi:putative transposase